LVAAKIEKQAAGAKTKTKTKEDAKGKIVEYLWHCRKQGRRQSTIKHRKSVLTRLLDLGADLFDPEDVKEKIAEHEGWRLSTKSVVVQVYHSFLETLDLTWERPTYKVPDTLPFIPLEKELDALINGSGKILGTFLQGLKDTGADPGELLPMTLIDIDPRSKTLRINHPVKGHNARILEISDVFISRVGTLRKRPEGRVFSNYPAMWSNFRDQRKRLAQKLANPRLLEISFRTFRHWKGTMEYHKTHDILHVKNLLGHKSVRSTEVYVHLEAAVFRPTNEEFHVKAVKTADEACKLVEVGFEFVDKIEGWHIYRKRK